MRGGGGVGTCSWSAGTPTRAVRPTVAGQLTPGQSAPEMLSMSKDTKTWAEGWALSTRNKHQAAGDRRANSKPDDAARQLHMGRGWWRWEGGGAGVGVGMGKKPWGICSVGAKQTQACAIHWGLAAHYPAFRQGSMGTGGHAGRERVGVGNTGGGLSGPHQSISRTAYSSTTSPGPLGSASRMSESHRMSAPLSLRYLPRPPHAEGRERWW